MKTREDGWIYFIQEEGGDAIKVGFANDVDERLKQLQTGNPRRLILLVAMPGDSAMEAVLHRCWERYRIRGEWFVDCKEIREAIQHEKDFAPKRAAFERFGREAYPNGQPDGYLSRMVEQMKRTAGRKDQRRARTDRAFWKRQGLSDAEVLKKMVEDGE